MANVLYDKTSSYPAAGSLREALFLHVWLRRQGVVLEQMKLITVGMANEKNADIIVKTYDDLITKMLPYLKGVKKETDTKMLEALRKEVATGHVPFQVLEDPKENLFRTRAASLSAPDAYRAKLAAGVTRRKGLKR
jgi:hypothetical protein